MIILFFIRIKRKNKQKYNSAIMLTKEKLIKTIQDLPDKFTLDDLLDRIVLLQKIEIGLEQSDNKQTKSTVQAKASLYRWLA